MDSRTVNLDTVDQYNRLYGLETLNPLVSVVDLNKATRHVEYTRWNYGIYALFLKLEKACDIWYGRQPYDYQEGTVVCFAPGQSTEIITTSPKTQINAYGILFHPDLLAGTALGKNIKRYSFFDYEANEALHLSEEERNVILDCLKIIGTELRHDVDRYSRRLLVNYIELLLNYCTRFYERQFTMRTKANSDILIRFERLLDDYFADGRARREGLPTVRYCAGELCLSPNYFGDLVKRETGRTAQEYIQLKLLDVAKELMLDPSRTIGEVAYELGFQYPQHFTRMFKKLTGQTPNAFRAVN